MSRRLTVVCGLLLLAGTAVLLAAPAQGQTMKKKKGVHHPHIHHALHELREARSVLKKAPHNFGGHRAKALVAINDAIRQLDLALLASGDNIKGIDHDKDRYKKYRNHPRLRHALHELREAHAELKNAAHNFGGHRKRALRDVNTAIVQLELALKHAQ